MEEKDYVDYGQALALKAIGFDEKVNFYYYENKKGYFEIKDNKAKYINFNSFNNNFISCSAPTIYEAQKWFRKKGLFIIVGIIGENDYNDAEFYWAIYNSHGFLVDNLISKDLFNYYEVALSDAITKCIEYYGKQLK